MIRSILLAIALTLLFAINAYGQYREQPPDHTTDELVAVRAKLIDRYVAKKGYAWGVSVCGTDDAWSGNGISYLTVYVYEDAVHVFNGDLAQYGKRLGNSAVFTVDGIPIFVQQIKRPKGKAHEPAKTERDDRQRRNSDRRSSFTLPS